MTITSTDPATRVIQESTTLGPVSQSPGSPNSRATAHVVSNEETETFSLGEAKFDPVPWETFPDIWVQDTELPSDWAFTIQAASDVVGGREYLSAAQRAFACPTIVQALLGRQMSVRLFSAKVSFPGWSTGEEHLVAIVEGCLVDGLASKISFPGCPVPKVVVAALDSDQVRGLVPVDIELASGAIISYRLTTALLDVSEAVPFVQRVGDLVIATIRRKLEMRQELQTDLEKRTASLKAVLARLRCELVESLDRQSATGWSR